MDDKLPLTASQCGTLAFLLFSVGASFAYNGVILAMGGGQDDTFSGSIYAVAKHSWLLRGTLGVAFFVLWMHFSFGWGLNK